MSVEQHKKFLSRNYIIIKIQKVFRGYLYRLKRLPLFKISFISMFL